MLGWLAAGSGEAWPPVVTVGPVVLGALTPYHYTSGWLQDDRAECEWNLVAQSNGTPRRLASLRDQLGGRYRRVTVSFSFDTWAAMLLLRGRVSGVIVLRELLRVGPFPGPATAARELDHWITGGHFRAAEFRQCRWWQQYWTPAGAGCRGGGRVVCDGGM